MPLGSSGAWLPRACTVVQPTSTPYMGIFQDEAAAGGTLWAYQYSGGTIGSLVATKTGVGFATVQQFCILSHSPLVIVFRDSADTLWVWNVTANTVASNGDHPAATYDMSSLAHGADGYVYFVESKSSIDAFKLFRINAAAAVSQITQGTSDTLASPLAGVPGNFCMWDGVAGFILVMGASGDSGIVRIEVGGASPSFIASDNAFPGDPTGDWVNWTQGHCLSTWAEAIAWNDFTGVIYGLWNEPGSEPYVDPFTVGVLNLVPNAEGDRYVIHSDDGRASLVDPGVVAQASIEWDTLDAGPTANPPDYVVPL